MNHRLTPWVLTPWVLAGSVTYPNDISCTFDYDLLDRLEGMVWTGPSGAVLSLDYEYDEAGMITSRVQSSASGDYTSSFAYDSLDRLTGETHRDEDGYVFDEATYRYDLAGNRTNKTHNGVTVTYDFGVGNRMTNWIAQVGTNAVAALNAAGSSSETIGTNPLFGERTVNEVEAQVSGTNFWAETVFTDLSQVTQQVIAAIGDTAGNVGRATNTWTLSIITNVAYATDDAGNVTNIVHNGGYRTIGLAWNSQYQLESVAIDSNEVERYTYDPFGRRLTTTAGSNTIFHVYDGIHCIADLDEAGDLVRGYTFGPGIDNPLAMTTYSATGTNTYYYLTDHLGSVLALTDEDGALVESYEYDAWGRVSVFDASNEAIAESAYGNRLTFQGREYSWATGLQYFRARWYDPVTGRWLSKDPIGISGGLNQYVAFNNNPVNFVDPMGLDVHKFKYRGKKVKIDDTKITPQGVAMEIKQMRRGMGLLDKVANMEGTFKDFNLGAVANAATGADKRYGTECQQYLRNRFEKYFKIGAFGAAEGMGRVVFSLGLGEDVLKSDSVSYGMARQAETASKRLGVYVDFLENIQENVYPKPLEQ